MQLLYFNSDDQAARKMHAEFLSYRGYQWDLKHCKNADQLMDELTDNAFDAVLLEQEIESFHFPETFERVISLADPKPVIALIRDSGSGNSPTMSRAEEHDLQLRLIEHGFHDVVGANSLTGSCVMRQLRLAQSRNQNYVYQPNEGHQTLLAKIDLAAAPSGSSTESVNGVFLMPAKPPKTEQPGRLRILNVETECKFDDLGKSLSGLIDAPDVTTVNRLSDAESILEKSEDFDVVLVEQEAIENQEIERHKGIRNRIRELPFIIGLIDRSDFSAVACLEKGFADAFVISRSAPEDILLCVQKTLARNQRMLKATAEGIDLSPANDRRQQQRSGRNRRRADRFLIEKPVTAICVMPDGAPDPNNAFHAHTVDVSLGGIGFKIPLLDRLPSRNWMLGLHCDDGQVRCVNALLRHVTYDDDGINIGAKFRPPSEDLLDPSNLASRIEPETSRVVYGMRRAALDQWAQLGVLHKSVAQRIKSCPECDAVSTVGNGCTQCGSARLEYKKLVHHFACAYVDDIEAFQSEAGISCPKCLTSDLVVGADFEVIKSQYLCQACDHSGNETAMVGSCFNCRLRYPLNVARELEVYRYDVQRLDILDFLSTAQ